MAGPQLDPSRLQGAELDRWYRRSPEEIEAEKRRLAESQHAAFVKGIQAQTAVHPQEASSDSPIDAAVNAFHNFQNGPKIQRPNVAESFIPVIGPAWEALADVQDGNYGAAAFNGAMAIADVLPFGVAVKGLKAAEKGVKILKEGSLSSGAATKMYRTRGMVKSGEETHHTIPLNGVNRSAQDWRNHFAFLKPLPKDVHRRLHGSWQGAPRYDPIRRIWYGTTDWMKAIPTGVAAYGADALENLTHSSGAAPGAVTTPLPTRFR